MFCSLSQENPQNVTRKKCLETLVYSGNAGTACVSERVLKTLACRGFCVGPSEVTCVKLGLFGIFCPVLWYYHVTIEHVSFKTE